MQLGDATEVRSKLADGLLFAGVLIMVELLMILLIKPIDMLFMKPGILVYVVVLSAITSICLERSLTIHDSDVFHAWMGSLSGLIAWGAIELSSWLGGMNLTSQTGILNLLLLFLVISVIWRRIATVGLRYFFLTLLTGWIEQVVLSSLVFLSAVTPEIGTIYSLLGYFGGAAAIVAIVYIFGRSQTRLDRLNAAIVVWAAVMLMVYVFRGGLI